MIVLPPFPVKDASLDSSNVPETDETEWSAGTYATGVRRMVTTPDVHRIYEVVATPDTTANPVTDQEPPPTGTSGANWQDVGPTNRWAMFDTLNGTQTVFADVIDVEITPGQITNMIALLNISAAQVQVIVTDPVEGEVYNRTIQMISDSGINDWYAYLFTPIERKTALVLTDLPAYSQATVRVIATETGQDVAIGVMAIGIQNVIGTALHGTGTGIIDYSIKETDAFGNFTILKRNFSKRADYAIRMTTGRTAFVQNLLASLRATPAVWVGDENNGATVVYGYYRDFEIILSDAVYSDASLQVEGLT